MKWILTRGNVVREFPSLKDIAREFDYSYSYVGYLYRENLGVKGWNISKVKSDENRIRKKYTQIELVSRVEELEFVVANLKHEVKRLSDIIGDEYEDE